MTSALWVATSRLSVDAVLAAIPPACRRPVEPATTARGEDELVVEGPVWPGEAAVQLVPSFAALTEVPYSVRLELSVRLGGVWSPWVAGVSLGPAAFPPPGTATGALAVDVDVFRARAPVDAVRARARLRGPVTAAAPPWLLTLSAAGPPPVRSALVPAVPATRLAVPALSQMEVDGDIGRRICSPTCVAMVLGYWNRPVPLGPLAAEIFHPPLDLYGVWPAAIRAASRHGLAGYLLRFPDWAAAAWCLQQRLPVIASIRYGRGELTGAAIEETAGHLVVLTGGDDGHVLVNDPAAPTAASVARRYRAEELARAWLERSGLGYVLFPAGAPG